MPHYNGKAVTDYEESCDRLRGKLQQTTRKAVTDYGESCDRLRGKLWQTTRKAVTDYGALQRLSRQIIIRTH